MEIQIQVKYNRTLITQTPGLILKNHPKPRFYLFFFNFVTFTEQIYRKDIG